MAVDVVLLCVVLFSAVLGAISGAARQLGQLVGLVAAMALARPLGAWAAPHLAQVVDLSPRLRGMLALVLAFMALYLVARLLATALLTRVLSGEDEERRGVDRTLGFVLGGLKVAVLAYALLSAATLVEGALRARGHRLDLGLGKSVAAGFARRHNLFELLRPAPAGPAAASAAEPRARGPLHVR